MSPNMDSSAQSPRIAFLPAGPMDVASSRLRCYSLARELAHQGYRTQVGLTPGDAIDVLFVQKRVDENILASAKAVKSHGGLVVYDIDDYGDAMAWLKVSPAVHSEFVQQCDALCVDTDVRLETFSNDPVYARIPEKWVIADPIDYLDITPVDPSVEAASPKMALVGCWFGNAPNIAPAVPYLEAARRCSTVSGVNVISNKEFLPKLSQMFPQFHIEAWQLASFPSRLRSTDFCLLIHDTNVEGVQKSNNKMLAALAQGVVPFVSRTPAYETTAVAMGLQDLLLDRPDDLANKLTPEMIQRLRQAIAAPACQRELKRFLPPRVAEDFSEKLRKLLTRHQIPTAATSQDKQLTIITHHYNNAAAVQRQLATWRSYPQPILDKLSFIIIDDHSDTPITPATGGLDVRLLRVETDIEWNQAGCRNLGISQAKTDWILLYDVDHTVDRANMERLLAGLPALGPDNLYQFSRSEEGMPIYSAPNCFLVKRDAIQQSGGYDEDFTGHYGYEDLYFLERWRLQGRNLVKITNVELQVKGMGTSSLDRNLDHNRALMEKKLANSPTDNGPRIRFRWREVSPTDSSPNGAAAVEYQPIRLNLGSGEQPLPGYVNVDLAPERRGRQPDVNCDIRDLHEAFPDNHADEILAVHVVEHFWRWEVVDILKEWVRVLKPGGSLVLECPNLISACEALLKDPLAGAQSDQRGNRTMWCFYGDPGWKDPLMCHRWLYTPQSLAQVMSEAGLKDLRQEPARFKAREPRDMRLVGIKPSAAR